MQVLRLEIGTLAQHSVFFQPYGKGKLRQAGALQSAQHQKTLQSAQHQKALAAGLSWNYRRLAPNAIYFNKS